MGNRFRRARFPFSLPPKRLRLVLLSKCFIIRIFGLMFGVGSRNSGRRVGDERRGWSSVVWDIDSIPGACEDIRHQSSKSVAAVSVSDILDVSHLRPNEHTLRRYRIDTLETDRLVSDSWVRFFCHTFNLSSVVEPKLFSKNYFLDFLNL